MSRNYRIYKCFREMGLEPNDTYGFDDWICFGDNMVIAVKLVAEGLRFIAVNGMDKEQKEFFIDLNDEELNSMYDYIESEIL